jgi:hypothetical protein
MRELDLPSMTRRRNEQRDARGLFKGSQLRPQSFMVAEVVAVIAEEHDDRVVPELQAIERFEQHTDLRVHEGGACVVGGHRFRA